MKHTPLACCGPLVAAMFCSCMSEPRMPAMDGAVVEVRRSGVSLTPGDAGYADTLQLSWFGSGCHLIRLGHLSVMTDPFVTNGTQIINARSDPQRVAATFAKLSPPDAIVINHSHIDHLLDAYAALTLPAWRDARVPLYGGNSSRHLLAGWNDAEVLARCHAIPAHGGEIIRHKRAGGEIRVTAYPSRHGAHMRGGHTFFAGNVKKPRSTPPSTLWDYPAGEVFNYLITMRNGSKTFRVFYMGAIAALEDYPHSLPPAGTKIDLVILCVPGARYLDSYPAEHLMRLRSRHIVLGHFNTLFKEDPDLQLSRAGIDMVKLHEMSRTIQAQFALRQREYPEFETLHIPAITIMEAKDRARNVIAIR